MVCEHGCIFFWINSILWELVCQHHTTNIRPIDNIPLLGYSPLDCTPIVPFVEGQSLPLQVYHRHARVINTSKPPPEAFLPKSHHQDKIDLPFALRKERWSTTKYLISQFLSYSHLSTFYRALHLLSFLVSCPRISLKSFLNPNGKWLWMRRWKPWHPNRLGL